ncbi:MAG: FCD domain-containing protein [Pseudomonadota bacterium]
MDRDHGGLVGDDGQSALVQLRAFITHTDAAPGDRLPPERELVDALGVTRNDLRKALALLEAEGAIWRHVGKGTFIGARPRDDAGGIIAIAERSSPVEVMRSRLLIEPVLAGDAARNATANDLADLRDTADASRRAASWREYEASDNALHRAVAKASNNTVLLAIFDTLNAIRRTVVWGRDRAGDGPPPPDHHSFAEHDAIIAAISIRDSGGAEEAMRTHLSSVRHKLIGD